MNIDSIRLRRRCLFASTALGLVSGILATSSPAAAQGATCSAGAISAFNVSGVTIVTATDVPAATPNPEYCDVIGTLNTSGHATPPGSAGFEVRLPVSWNGKFLFFGVGGLAGSTYADLAANPVDVAEALGKGYATAITDTGHQAGGTDASWALIKPGVPDRAKVADYYFRATHEVTIAAKALVSAFYGNDISYSYFDGCSNGGHQATTEAADYPGDYDGIIAGAPFFDARAILQGTHFTKQQFSSPAAFLTADLLPAIDKAIAASCDAADGVADGLIQNPGACSFDASTLICGAGQTTDCLTPQQATTLNAYFTGLRDEQGRLVHTGYSVSDLTGGFDTWTLGLVAPTDPTAAEPWGNAGFNPSPIGWQFNDHFIKFLVEQDPNFPLLTFPVTASGTVDDQTLALFDSRLDEVFMPSRTGGFAAGAADYAPFLQQHRKLILYHGLSDQALSPFRTTKLYEDMAGLLPGGYGELSADVRLFLVPGMQHCGGGPGPNVFETLTPLERWVENGVAPDSVLASHYAGNVATAPVDRSMPLCPFPIEAKYSGSGDVNDAANWSCPTNTDMLKVGTNGQQAGLQQ